MLTSRMVNETQEPPNYLDTALTREIKACQICADRFKTTHTGHSPRPVVTLSSTAPILIAGQAPGNRVHKSGLPFDDPSGDRLREWLGVDKASFYNPNHFAILPMGFCFPGYNAKGADLPPPKICAKTWREKALGACSGASLIILLGGHAQDYHLGKGAGVYARVENWQEFGPKYLPLPHPSWRNTAWLNRHSWFEETLLPSLRARVKKELAT